MASADALFIQLAANAQALEGDELRKFADEGGVEQLLKLCRTSRNPAVLQNACAALGCMACGDSNVAQHAWRLGVVKTLLAVCEKWKLEPGVVEGALFGLGGVADRNVSAAAECFELSGLTTLFSFFVGDDSRTGKPAKGMPLYKFDEPVRQNSCWVLASMARKSAVADAILALDVEEGDTLITLLQQCASAESSRSELARNAALALSNLILFNQDTQKQALERLCVINGIECLNNVKLAYSEEENCPLVLAQCITRLAGSTPAWHRRTVRALIFSQSRSRRVGGRARQEAITELKKWKGMSKEEREAAEAQRCKENSRQHPSSRAVIKPTFRKRPLTSRLQMESSLARLPSLDAVHRLEEFFHTEGMLLDRGCLYDPDLHKLRCFQYLQDFFRTGAGDADGDGIADNADDADGDGIADDDPTNNQLGGELLIVVYSGRGFEGSGAWDVVGDGSGFGYDTVIEMWKGSNARRRGALLLLLLDSCGADCWVRRAEEDGLTDVAIQGCCGSHEASLDKVFLEQWVAYQGGDNTHAALLDALRADGMQPSYYTPWPNHESGGNEIVVESEQGRTNIKFFPWRVEEG